MKNAFYYDIKTLQIENANEGVDMFGRRRRSTHLLAATSTPPAEQHQRNLGSLQQYGSYNTLAAVLQPGEVAVLKAMADMGGIGTVLASPAPKSVRVDATNFDFLVQEARLGHFLWAELYAMPENHAPAPR